MNETRMMPTDKIRELIEDAQYIPCVWLLSLIEKHGFETRDHRSEESPQ